MNPTVVVGASLAGMGAVQSLRDAGHDGPVVVLDPSPSLPEDRPPLSKQVLAGEWELERATQPVVRVLDDLDVDLRLGTAAEALDAAGLTVTPSVGEPISAAGVLVATGSRAVRLGGSLPQGAHTLRTGADCAALRADLDAAAGRVVVVGAGFIGAEVAATCRQRGLEVTMVEAAEVPLQRALPGDIGSFVADLHRAHGVDVRLGVGIDALRTDAEGRVAAVSLADGSEVEASVVVVGIGAAPETGWLEGSGLTLRAKEEGGGVLCDETLLAAPGVVAAGDVAAWPNPHFRREVMRVEHWENAIDQGAHAGRRLLAEITGGERGDVEPFASVPWFWSDQYDAKIQMVGRPGPQDEVVVVDGSVAEGRFVALFRRGDTCRAALGVNRPRLVMKARMQLARSLDWEPVAEMFG